MLLEKETSNNKNVLYTYIRHFKHRELYFVFFILSLLLFCEFWFGCLRLSSYDFICFLFSLFSFNPFSFMWDSSASGRKAVSIPPAPTQPKIDTKMQRKTVHGVQKGDLINIHNERPHTPKKSLFENFKKKTKHKGDGGTDSRDSDKWNEANHTVKLFILHANT